MSRLMEATADRVAPWRRADWRVLIVEGVALIVAGTYLLADGERAEFILGLLVGAALLVDGIRQWLLGFRQLGLGRTRDVTLTRGAVGIVTGGLVLALSLLQQITVVGIRIAIGVGGFAYGVLGLLLTLPAIRTRQLSVTAAVYDVLLVLVSLLLLYRVATSDSIAGLLAATSWLVIGTGIAIVIVGVMRRSTTRAIVDPNSDGAPPA